MPKKPNKVLRLVVPLAAIAVGLIAVWAFVNNAANPRTATRDANRQAQAVPAAPEREAAPRPGDEPRPERDPDRQPDRQPEPPITDEAPLETPPADAPPPTDTPGDPVAGEDDAAPDRPAMGAGPDGEPAPRPEADGSAPPGQFVARTIPEGFPTNVRSLGGLGAASDFRLRVEFTRYAAGVREIRLARHYNSVQAMTRARTDPDNVTEEDFVRIQRELRDESNNAITPFMVLGLSINGAYTDLSGFPALSTDSPRPLWAETAPGRFVATIVDDQGREAFRVTRAYRVEADSYDISIRTTVENLTNRPAELVLYQYGPGELEREQASYGGDIRRVRFGYIVPSADPGRRTVLSDAFIWRQQSREVMGRRVTEQTQWGPQDIYPATHPIWPNTRSQNRSFDLVWAAFTDRYFGVAVHPSLPADHTGPIPSLQAGQRIDRVVLNRFTGDGAAMRLTSAPVIAEPGGRADFSVSVYAGPQSASVIRDEPRASAAGVYAIVLYNFGGLCAACTFPILTNALFGILILLHDYLVFDWALAIILLVVIVRTILHPVTRWSQVRMQRFGKQMQAMAPKQKKLQEKFKDDPKRMQQEMRKLWAEEGVNPAGLLGCLPMFLQTPVWIALFATLFFAVELRHQPAFFGLFQNFGGWTFLGDLAAPDSFVKFATGITLPWKGVVDSINVLPLLLGVVFYFHQKYLTPATPNMTPEQAQQQKIIKVMTVVMFPIFMYTAPSGLTIYFITNSVLAIFETRWIRASAEKKGLLDPEQYKQRKQAKRAGKPGGFMARLQAAAEQAQALREQQQAAKGKGANPPGAGKSKQLRPSRPDPVDPNRRFKRRK